MRLVFLSNANSVHLKEWAEYFHHELGHACTVLTIPPQTLGYDGVPVVRVGHRLSGSKLGWPTCIPAIRRELERAQADLFIAYRVVSYGFLATLVGFRPLVLAAQGGDIVWPPDDRFGQVCARHACRNADFFNAWSDNIRDELVRYDADPAQIFVCSRGIDLATFPTLPTKPTGPLTICVTRGLLPSYNFKQLIAALPHVLGEVPDARVEIAGDGPERANLERQAAELGVSGAVRFMGQQPRQGVIGLLRRAHVYVSTTISDGLPLSHFEAMAAGCVPVVSDIVHNRIWIQDGVNGCLAPIGDDLALARGILRAWRDGELRARAVPLNRQLVAEKHDRRVNLRRIEAAWEELIARFGT